MLSQQPLLFQLRLYFPQNTSHHTFGLILVQINVFLEFNEFFQSLIGQLNFV